MRSAFYICVLPSTIICRMAELFVEERRWPAQIPSIGVAAQNLWAGSSKNLSTTFPVSTKKRRTFCKRRKRLKLNREINTSWV